LHLGELIYPLLVIFTYRTNKEVVLELLWKAWRSEHPFQPAQSPPLKSTKTPVILHIGRLPTLYIVGKRLAELSPNLDQSFYAGVSKLEALYQRAMTVEIQKERALLPIDPIEIPATGIKLSSCGVYVKVWNPPRLLYAGQRLVEPEPESESDGAEDVEMPDLEESWGIS
jgi:hypothetical protein